VILPVNVSIDDVTAPKNDNVTTPIRINTTEPCSGAIIEVRYNESIVNITNATRGTFGGTFAPNLYYTDEGWVRIVADVGANPSLTGDVVFANLILEAVGNFTEVSPLNITVVELLNDVGMPIPYNVMNGSLTIMVKGDVSGDNVVNVWDCTYLARAIAGWPGYEYNEMIADVSGDRVVNVWDCTYLARHIAGQPGYLI